MRNEYGLKIKSVTKNSCADSLGFQPNDVLLSINSQKIRDVIDLMFYGSEDKLSILINRNEKLIRINTERKIDSDFGIEFQPFKVMTCKNNCVFCFVKQLPKGLRKTLYIKDEDYRLSFLYGNYITLSNLTKEDKIRIVKQKISPLYISVHSTNRDIRNKLLGNNNAPDIVKELRFLADNRIYFNAQIVLCPGFNDGEDLKQTISTLYKFYPYLLSIAVVPVGLTIYNKTCLKPVEKKEAVEALEIIENFQKRFQKKHGNPIVYGSDELYLKAESSMPNYKLYGNFPQLENGVGMVSMFMYKAKKIKPEKGRYTKKKILTFTGVSFYPFLKKFIDRLNEREEINVDVVPVENLFFGKSITVTGLLTGRDVIKKVLNIKDNYELLLIPDVVLNNDDKFLDDVTLEDVESALGINVKKIESTPDGFIEGIRH
jgi:putative radical SAM enzyme (TIGR03279 family)